ncbi:MAG: hypothetical protein AAB955_01000 [Patescibacteria group bacterium]
MNPLSSRTRNIYFLLLTFAFVLVVPVAVLYATGYRLRDFSLQETGGVYVTVPISDVVVTINGEEVGKSGLFDRTLYIPDLSPDKYVVQATREGYYPWTKTITVEPWIVTDALALMVPTTIQLTEEPVATSTLAAFATTTVQESVGGMELLLEDGDVSVRWIRNPDNAPSAFCFRPSACASEITILRGKEDALGAVFFSGGVVYRTQTGIYFSDIETRSPQLILPLYTRPKADFRIIDDALVIKDGASYYRIDSF